MLVSHAKYAKNQAKGEYVSGQTHETTIENFGSSGSDSLMCQEKKHINSQFLLVHQFTQCLAATDNRLPKSETLYFMLQLACIYVLHVIPCNLPTTLHQGATVS